MRTTLAIIALGGLTLAGSFALAQRPGGGGPGGPPGGGGPGGFGGGGLSKSADVEDLLKRMLAFDSDKDGKLARAEVTDQRLLGLFDRADVDKDGAVTKAELTALAEKEYVGGGGGFSGPGGPPPGGGFGGRGGPGGPGGPMGPPGTILSPMLQQRLGLSNAQKAQVAELQAEVDTKLEKLLNEEQRKQLQQMRERGMGGPGGGPGGPGGPGGGRRGGPGGGGPGGPGGPGGERPGDPRG